MEEKISTTKIWLNTLKKLRIIRALTGETQPEVLDRILTEELKKMQKMDMIAGSIIDSINEGSQRKVMFAAV